MRTYRTIAIVIISILCFPPLFAAGNGEESHPESPVRIGVMPDAGALPLFLMDRVETVPFMSARERDMAMQMGELDGMMSDMVSQLNFRKLGMNQPILTVTESCFQLVGPKGFDESGQWSVGISENTVVEFMVDQLVPEEVRADRLDKVAIPAVPVRLEMLRTGKVPLACLSDVMAKALPEGEFFPVRSQKGTGLEPAILLFSEDFLAARPGMAESLGEDWNEAVGRINADPEAYREMLYENLRLPQDSDYPVPHYRPVTLPPRETLMRVQDWYSAKYGVDDHPSYEDLVIGTGE